LPGKGDQTICYHCGVGLKDWVETDDPWVEHALWSSKCTYVLQRKGLAFVEKVLDEKQFKLPCLQEEEKEEEVEDLKKAAVDPPHEVGLCKICYTEEIGILFLPCGHIVACVKCAPSLSVCAVCRQPVTATVRAYLS
jgi:baculoviral IAP repeat-containing protein 7/8